jgi:D-alanyl-D-alanine carboxypeptidase
VAESVNALLMSLFDTGREKLSTGEVLWHVKSDDGAVNFAHGDLDRQFFIASATKLFVTAIMAQLRVESRVDWDLPIANYLPHLNLSATALDDALYGAVTIRAVMSHTAGLPDYFEGKRPDGSSTFRQAIEQDFSWDVVDVVEWTRQLTPPKRGKSLYSDTGYQLLGALIEEVDGCSFGDSVAQRICQPLGLDRTYVFSHASIGQYSSIATMMNGSMPLEIPRAMASVQADGGIVSTSRDTMSFLAGFFHGRLFPQPLLKEIAVDWHRIFQPLEYGTGIMRFRLPPVMTGFRRVPAFIGHSGASGTVMFRSPDARLSIVGTVNQVQKRSLPFRLMVKSAMQVQRFTRQAS